MDNFHRTPPTLIFDFDGTIADTFSYYLTILDKLSKKFGFNKIEIEQANKYRDMDSRKVIEQLRIPKIKLPFIVWEARKLLKKQKNQIFPFSGIRELMVEIRKRDILLGILTSNSVQNVKSFLEENQFPDFDFIFSSIQIWSKSKILKRILHHHKLQAQTVFYVGDETRDIEAVREAGIKSIAVTWGYNSKEILQSYSPDYLISEPNEIIRIVDGIIGG